MPHSGVYLTPCGVSYSFYVCGWVKKISVLTTLNRILCIFFVMCLYDSSATEGRSLCTVFKIFKMYKISNGRMPVQRSGRFTFPKQCCQNYSVFLEENRIICSSSFTKWPFDRP